jgi:hypothetical protein
MEYPMAQSFLGQQAWPTNVVMPSGAQTISEWAMGLFVGAMLVWGVRNIIVRRDSALVICMIAGYFTCVLEPHLMVLYKFFYPQIGQHVLFEGFGQPVPIFLGFCYSAFFGPAAYFLLRSNFLRSFTLKRFLIGMFALVAAEVALEIVSVRAGVWLYFGDQPFTIGDFPVHVAVVVGCACVVLGSIARIWFDRVRGAQQWWLLVVCPISMIAVFSVFAYPVAFALGSGGGVSASRVGALATMALSLVLAYVCAKQLARIPDLGRTQRL